MSNVVYYKVDIDLVFEEIYEVIVFKYKIFLEYINLKCL